VEVVLGEAVGGQKQCISLPCLERVPGRQLNKSDIRNVRENWRLQVMVIKIPTNGPIFCLTWPKSVPIYHPECTVQVQTLIKN
jgi:hypothetical protein